MKYYHQLGEPPNKKRPRKRMASKTILTRVKGRAPCGVRGSAPLFPNRRPFKNGEMQGNVKIKAARCI